MSTNNQISGQSYSEENTKASAWVSWSLVTGAASLVDESEVAFLAQRTIGAEETVVKAAFQEFTRAPASGFYWGQPISQFPKSPKLQGLTGAVRS